MRFFWDAQPLLRKRVLLPTSDAEEQKDDEVADNGDETDEIDAALLDILALLGRGGQKTYNHVSRDLEEPGEAVDALRNAVKVFLYTRVNQPQMNQDHENYQHEYRA
jgi:hypothetical protein